MCRCVSHVSCVSERGGCVCALKDKTQRDARTRAHSRSPILSEKLTLHRLHLSHSRVIFFFEQTFPELLYVRLEQGILNPGGWFPQRGRAHSVSYKKSIYGCWHHTDAHALTIRQVWQTRYHRGERGKMRFTGRRLAGRVPVRHRGAQEKRLGTPRSLRPAPPTPRHHSFPRRFPSATRR